MKHLKLFFALFAMLALNVGNAWGANYEIVAKKGSGDGSSLSTSTKVTDVFSNGTYVAKFTTASKSYYNGSNGLKLGASSSAGDLKFTLTDGGKVKATTIIVSAKRYNTSKSVTLQVIAGGVTCTAQTISNSSNFTDYTYTINANITDIQLKTSKYCWVESITINYEDGGTEEPVLSSIEISGDLENKTYEEGDELDLTGLTVQANYESGDPKDVTNDVEWSYEPLTAGQTSVTVTATYEDKTATQPINGLTVNEHIVTPGEKCTGTLGYAFWGLTAEKLTATANEINYTKEFDDVTVNIKNGSKANAYFKADHTRVYSGGYTMTFSVPDGYIITDIAFTASGDNWEGTHTANVGTMSDNKNWTGANQNVTITFNGSCRIASICVTYKADVKYALTITEPTEGGTLVVKDGENTLTSGAEIYEGTKLTVTATPANGYEGGTVVVKDAVGNDVTATVYADGVLTMPAYAVTISATFAKKPCTLLTTPVVTATPTYNSATLTWAAIANAAKYSVTVGETTTEVTEPTYTATGLTAETTYTYQVQAIAEAGQDTYCDSEVAEGTFTTATAPIAKLILKDIVGETTLTGSLNGTITLPTEAAECSKTFVGWDADENCDHAPTYAKGAEYTLAAETKTLYAVYADGESGEVVTQTLTITDQTTNSTYGNNSFTDNKGGVWSGQSNIPDATHFGLRQNDDNTHMASPVFPNNIINITAKIRNQSKSERKVYLCSNNTTAKPSSGDLGGVNVNGSVTDIEHTFTLNGTFNQFYMYTNGALQFNEIEVTYSSAPTYSNYSTTCAAAPKAEVTPTEVTATAAGAEGKVTVTYENVNTASVSVALYNDEACTETFTAGWLTAAIDVDENISYTVAENTTYAERKAYIQLTAPETTGAVDPAVVVIPVTQAAKDKVFASLEALLAAITPTTEGVEVTVTLTNEVIQDFYTSSSYRNGIALNVPYQGGVKVIEIYCKDVPAEWVKGGKVSGTITCPWKLYNSTWELCPTAWTELTYTAPATVKSIAVSGTPTKTTYVDGEAFDPTGLVVTATLTDDSTEPIDVALVDWTFDPETLSKGETSVSVVATYNTMASAAYEVTGLTVNDIPTKTVPEFIAAGGTRCYLEGIVSGLTEGNSMKYGNFDLTDASGTIYVYGCLNGAGESQKFAELGVKNGDKIKVIADEYELYGGTKDEAKNVQYVSHVSAASITVENITMEVEEVATITATVDPVDAVVTYTIKENAANAISLSGKTITALAEGTATITATVAEGATYLGNSVDFTVTVGPKTVSDEVVILAEHNGQWYALKAEDLNGEKKVLAALAVTYFNGTLYNVNESDKISITWTRTVVGDQVTFKNGTNYLYVANPSKTELSLNATAFSWTYDAVLDTYTSNNGARTFLYSSEANGFKNFAINNNVGTKNYSGYPVVTAPVYTTGDVTYTRATTAGKFGTICLPFGSTNYTGAEFFEFVGSETGKVYIGSVDELVAGVPYIFLASAAKVVVTSDGTTAATPGNSNGLYGTFTDNTEVAVGNYILKDNALCQAEAICWVNAYRAYIVMSEVPTGVPTQMPGRRYIGMSVQGENETTGVEDLFTTDTPVKVIENGQLIIIRDGVKYNVQGQKL